MDSWYLIPSKFKSFRVVVNNTYVISYPKLVSKCFLYILDATVISSHCKLTWPAIYWNTWKQWRISSSSSSSVFFKGEMGEYTYIVVISVKYCWVQTPRAKLVVRSPFIHLSFRGKHVYKTQIYYWDALFRI